MRTDLVVCHIKYLFTFIFDNGILSHWHWVCSQAFASNLCTQFSAIGRAVLLSQSRPHKTEMPRSVKKRPRTTSNSFSKYLQFHPALDIVTSWTSGARHLRHVDFDFVRKKEHPLWFKIHSTLKSNPLSFNLCSGWFLVLMRRSPRAFLFLQRRLADHCRHAGYACRVFESLTASEKILLNPELPIGGVIFAVPVLLRCTSLVPRSMIFASASAGWATLNNQHHQLHNCSDWVHVASNGF